MTFDDGVVAESLPVGEYFFLGWLTLARSKGVWIWRLVRGLTSLGAGLFAVALGAFASWLLTLPASERLEAIDEPVRRVDGYFASLSAVESGQLLTAILIGVFVLLIVRGWVDAKLFTSFRRACGSCDDTTAKFSDWWGSFFGLALIHFGLTVGGVMFLSPVLRVASRVALEHEGAWNTALFLWLTGLGSIAVLAYLKFAITICTAYLTWRPRFFAGTLVAAIASPFRAFLMHAKLFGIYAFGYVFLTCAAAFAARPLLVTAFAGTPTGGSAVGIVLAFGFVLASWFDAVMITLVGHRIGDVSAAQIVEAPSMTKESKRTIRQNRLEPPVRGVFVASSPEVSEGDTPSVVSFTELLGDEGLKTRWEVLGAHALDVDSLEKTPDLSDAGVPELVWRTNTPDASDNAHDIGIKPASLDADKHHSESLSSKSVPSGDETKLAPLEVEAHSLEELGEQLGARRYRSDSGALELSWRP